MKGWFYKLLLLKVKKSKAFSQTPLNINLSNIYTRIECQCSVFIAPSNGQSKVSPKPFPTKSNQNKTYILYASSPVVSVSIESDVSWISLFIVTQFTITSTSKKQ